MSTQQHNTSNPPTATTQHRLPVTKPTFSPSIIMSRPETLARLMDSYFRSLQPKPEDIDFNQANELLPPTPAPPTCAGLALHLGFSSTNVMLTAATAENKHSRESRHLLMTAITMIEDKLVTGGLTNDLNTSLTKHILSAQHEVIPKTEVIGDAEANKININILGVSTPTPVTIANNSIETPEDLF